MFRVLSYLWASPYTVLGLAIGSVGLLAGARTRIRGPVLQFHSGLVQRLIRQLLGKDILAITLGHTVLGQTEAALDDSYKHELVHVRQFERWGPLMGPAYLLCSLVLWFRGGRAYRDNPFEREAYGDLAQ
jgi:hypothetical protein